MAKKAQNRQPEMEQPEQEQPEQEQQPTWSPVDMEKEGTQEVAAQAGIIEKLVHKSGKYTLIKKMVRQYRQGRYRHVPRWQLRKGCTTVHEVLEREQLETIKAEAEAYIAEAEQADMEMADSHVVELPGGMTEEQFEDIYEDEEDE